MTTKMPSDFDFRNLMPLGEEVRHNGLNIVDSPHNLTVDLLVNE
jgi:hypothetical protein